MLELVLCAALVAHIDVGGIEPRLQLARAAHEIGVNVGLENVRDRNLRLPRHLDVDIAVRARVENCRDPFFIVAEQVGKLGDAFSLDGFENERHAQT